MVSQPRTNVTVNRLNVQRALLLRQARRRAKSNRQSLGRFVAREYTGPAREVWSRVSESAGSTWWLISLLATAACLPVWYLLRLVDTAFAVALSTALLVAVCTPIGMLLAIALKQVSVVLTRASDTHVQLALERPDTLWALSIVGYCLGAALGLAIGLWLFF